MSLTPKRALALAALAAVLAAPAAAQPRPGMMSGIDAFDPGSSGAITREDLDTRRAESIARLDADGDGFVTREELVAFQLEAARARIEARAEAMFERMDADGDGRLSAAELMVRPLPTRMFDRLDADGDGTITAEEYQAARNAMQERRAQGPRSKARGDGQRGHRHHFQQRRGGEDRPGRGWN
ncbi:MAG: EF-hand domain-containing protein [Gemmobacter sp.]